MATYTKPVIIEDDLLSYSSFANCNDSTTNLRFIILLTNGSSRTKSLTSPSHKFCRLVQSLLAVETYAFSDCLDAIYVMKKQCHKYIQSGYIANHSH